MNYGKKGVRSKQQALNSKSTKWGRKIALYCVKIFLIGIITIGVIGICAGIGMFKSIIDKAPSPDPDDIAPSGYSSFVYDLEGRQTAKLVASRDVAEHIEPPKLTDILPFLRIFSSKIFLLLLAVLALLILLIIVLAASRRAARQRRRREIYERRKQEYMRRQQMARSGGQYSPPQRRRSDPYDGGYTVRRSSGSSAGGRHAAPRSTAPARSSSSRSASASRGSYDRRRPR